MRLSLLCFIVFSLSSCSADKLRSLKHFQRLGDNEKKSGKKGSSSRDDNPELTFLDQIQYPYDAWLPQESASAAERLKIPSLSQPFYDNVIDVRATVSAKDTELILSTAGSWQFALTEFLNNKFFVDNPSVQDSYLITTSPPISVAQLRNGRVKVGNILYKDAEPHVAIGPQGLMNVLTDQGFIPGDFTPFPFYQNYGNVILKLKGNTKINEFADLAKIEPGRFGSTSVGAVTNLRNSIRNIFNQNQDLVEDLVNGHDGLTTGEALEARLFDEASVVSIGPPMHHSIPHVLVTDQADAGIIFLELAVGIMRNNPGVFEAIYLAKDKSGSTDDPEVLKLGQDPLDGNVVVTFLTTITNTAANTAQETARDNFIQDLKSADLTTILADSGLRRPPSFLEE